MAKLTAGQRKSLPSGSFAVPSQAPGSGSYPIPDASHARNALARVAQHGSPAVKAKVRAAVRRRYPSIQQASTKGSPTFTPDELNAGYRRLGSAFTPGEV